MACALRVRGREDAYSAGRLRTGKNSSRTGAWRGPEGPRSPSRRWLSRTPSMARSLLKDIVAVRHLGGHRLWLRFEDGIEGEINLRDVIVEFRGVLAALLDPVFVAQVRVHTEFGTITWPGELDLDPVVLYAHVTGTALPKWGTDDALCRSPAGERPGTEPERDCAVEPSTSPSDELSPFRV